MKSIKCILVSSVLFIFSCKEKNEHKEEKKYNDPKVANLKLQEGFHAEHLYSPYESGTGSWVSMTFDDKGRLICSDQYGALYRVEIPPIGADTAKSKVRVEKIKFDLNTPQDKKNKLQMGYAQGLVWAFNSLYVVVNHRGDSLFEKTSGFYRLQDTDNNDAFDKITLLKSLVGEEEHGPHSVKLAPDGKSFYVIAGNNTDLPERLNSIRPPAIWKRDNLLPSLNRSDPRTRAAAGWIAHVDSSGKKWDLIAAGFRNPFDLAFDETGEIFTYDSDMEWDIGMAWYRPTRICHVPSGAEFGWRDGNGKWSPSYLDNLPPVLNIGQGSPTNLISLSEARFPKKYKQTLLASDWSFGIMYAIHLKQEGASYSAEPEEFLSGAPLPLTDGVIGPDGALYFLTGGRRLTSDLYRVYYQDGKAEKVSANSNAIRPTAAAETRKKIEAFHTRKDPAAVEFVWPYLKDQDRFIRFAARIALEHQPVEQWQERALNEKDPVALTHALISLARHGNAQLKNRIIDAITAIDYEKLNVQQQIDVARTVEVVLARMGKPDAARISKLNAYLGSRYPSQNNDLNRVLGKSLVYLGDTSFVAKTLAMIDLAKDDTTEQRTVSTSSDLILRNPQYGMDIANVLKSTPPAQQIYYAILLSDAKAGWTVADREKYFRWLFKAFGYRGGRHYPDYIRETKKLALGKVPRNQYKYYDSISTNIKSESTYIDWVKIMADGGPGRQWKVQAALDTVAVLKDRDFDQAKKMLTAAACISCHSIAGEGGSIGPDLTQLGTRFTKRDILESIIEPNKVISDQYASTVYVLKDGTSVVGRPVKEDKEKYYISQNRFASDQIRELNKKDVASTKIADVSIMPPALINSLNPERLRDLMAYLISGGNEKHPVFAKKEKRITKK